MKPPRVRLKGVEGHVLNMRTRMPFKYGIATLSALPHLMLRADVEVDGRVARGVAAEGLPPKWFTKDPATTFAEDLRDMLDVIRHAANAAVTLGECATAFDWWFQLHEAQTAWGRVRGFPPLLTGLGTSLMERAMIDAVCRACGEPFPQMLQANAWGVRLDRVHPELGRGEPADYLPREPVRRVAVRHTVGLADPLEEGEIADADRLADGLPQSLAAGIARYGLRYFKVKLCGQVDRDMDRLIRFAGVIRDAGVREPAWTLDGNEQFASVGAFRGFWERWSAEPRLEWLRSRLVVVEQPLARSVALAEDTGRELRAWSGCPAMIIDESDGELGSLHQALGLGYAGTSHKNCKGVFRGIAHACVLAARRQANPGGVWHLTSEDLASVGPVAMPSDLAVAACLGLNHSERNGHHYFRGLSPFPRDVQEAVLSVHGDLYERAPEGFATLRIREGLVETGSLLAAPFGCGIDLDSGRYTPWDEWTPRSLEI